MIRLCDKYNTGMSVIKNVYEDVLPDTTLNLIIGINSWCSVAWFDDEQDMYEWYWDLVEYD